MYSFITVFMHTQKLLPKCFTGSLLALKAYIKNKQHYGLFLCLIKSYISNTDDSLSAQGYIVKVSCQSKTYIY